jgi:hypothetical protein
LINEIAQTPKVEIFPWDQSHRAKYRSLANEQSIRPLLSVQIRQLTAHSLPSNLLQIMVAQYILINTAKLTILGYLISNIFGVEFNMPIKRKPKYLTEYYTLAN